MTKPPSPTTIYKLLQDTVKRMEAVEKLLQEHEYALKKITRWKEDTEFAKRLLEDWQEKHPELVKKEESINMKIVAALIGALGILGTVILAMK
jgi:hypothetical protein